MALEGTLGFLGFGNMGTAILRGLLAAGTIEPATAAVYDPDPARQDEARRFGVRLLESPEALGRASKTLVLAVKPQVVEQALAQIKPAMTPAVLVLSIAAGISTQFIQQRLGADIRVARVMPNTPALVSAGAAGFALSPNCSPTDAHVVRTMFEAVGTVERVPESLLDAVTALSGSGPAYFFHMAECLVRAAVKQGLPDDQAARLAAQTLYGAGRLLKESGESAAALRARVTSKGGTTEAALAQFEVLGFDRIVADAVAAAVRRAQELGR